MQLIFWALIFYFFLWPMLKKTIGVGGGPFDYEQLGRDGSEPERVTALAIVLGMRMGAVDGSFDPSELQALIRAIPHQSDSAIQFAEKVIGDVYKGAMRQHDEASLFRLLQLDPSRPTVRDPLLTVLADVARADGIVGDIEKRYFVHVAALCGLSTRAAEQRIGGFSSGHRYRSDSRSTSAPPSDYGERSRHLSKLGLKPGASQAEIKKRFHELARQLHPDRVAHIGGEIEELVSREFREVKEAYEALSQ